MNPKITIKGSDIPMIISELQKLQKIVDRNQEIMVSLEGHLDFEGLLEILIDTSLQLSSYRSIVSSKVNPAVQEPLFVEEDESTGTHKTVPVRGLGKNLNGINTLSEEKFAIFNYDKNADGSVNLERKHFDIPSVRVNHELYKWFMKIAETAVQLRHGLGIFTNSQYQSQSRIPLPKGLVPTRSFHVNKGKSKDKKNEKKKNQSIKAYHLRKKSKRKTQGGS